MVNWVELAAGSATGHLGTRIVPDTVQAIILTAQPRLLGIIGVKPLLFNRKVVLAGLMKFTVKNAIAIIVQDALVFRKPTVSW